VADEITPLPPGSAPAFQAWLAANRVRDLDHPDSHYDYRGAFLAGVGRGNDTGHFPDTFKQHGHPTFSVESKYSTGPGDGGSWNGDTYVPQRPVRAMTQSADGWSPDGARFLPGQDPLGKVPFGMGAGPVKLPGINDQPGQRFGGPAPVAPEQIDLDAPERPATPAPGEPTSGIRFRDQKTGKVEATFSMDPVTTGAYQQKAIQKIGDALVSQAVTPEEHAAAARATAYGLSLVGALPTADIQKAIASRYDQDMGNSTKLQLQGMRSANKHGKPGGPGAPGAAPSKADQYAQKLDDNLRKTAMEITESERKDTKHAALAQTENEINEMDQLLSGPSAMGGRIAVQKALLALTGKASRESEQQALTGSAGMLDQIENKAKLWTSDDPKLTAHYIGQFKQMLATERKYIAEARAKSAESAAQRAYALSFGYPDDQRQLVHDIVRGDLSGEYGGAARYAAPVAHGAPAGGKVDDDLVQ
jgi:hypothetical protein